MVRLDKDKSKGSNPTPTPINSEEKKTLDKKENSQPDKPVVQITIMANGELEKFSQNVLKNMIEENVPPTPSNFQIYFDKHLEVKPAEFKKRLTELMELENIDEEEHVAGIERDAKKGFSKIKTMLQGIATIYKNLSVMKALVKKRLKELETNTSVFAVQNVMNSFDEDLTKLSTLMERHLDLLKNSYEEVTDTLKSIESQVIFDVRYGVYNKKYFLKTLETELERTIKYGYTSSLMLLRIKDKVLGVIPSSKDKSALLRNIAKLLMKTSRRSDIVAHYGDGIFGMVMKHTNIDNAKKACDRISELIYATSFFISEMELEIDVEISIIELQSDKTIPECISLVLDTLPQSGKNTHPFVVAQWKK